MSSRWVTKTVVGIVLATFFSDVGHEMVTAVLPFFIASIGLGPATLGALAGDLDGVAGHATSRGLSSVSATAPKSTDLSRNARAPSIMQRRR